MKELFKIEKPQAVTDAAEAQKGMHIALELLVFLGVFLVATIAQGIILSPASMVLLLTNNKYLEAIASGNLALVAEVSMEVSSTNAYTILMLFSTIGMTAIAMLFCKLIQKRKMTTLGFHKKGFVKDYLIGLGAGFVMFSVAVLLCVLTGSLKLEGFSSTFAVGTFLLFTVGYMLQGMSEEVLCRGYLMVSVGRRYSMLVAIIANAVFFAVLHLMNNGISVLAFINLVLFGVFASVYFIKTDNIWGVGALHSVWNLVQGNVYGIRVSGMETSCTVFSSQMVEGKELINGGAFGLEGGIAVTIVLVVGIVIMLFMKNGKKQKIHTV